MRAAVRATALSLALALAPDVRPAVAADIAACFVPGEGGGCAQPVLQHVEFKSVVAEFVWPAGGGLGHALSRYLWREVLESIQDLRGAGVILAHDRERDMRRQLEGRDPRSFLETDYHDAALQIARVLDVQMALWGMALADGEGGVYVQTYLTLLPGEEESWTRLRLNNRALERGEMSVDIARGRLAFAPWQAARTDLFARRFATRCALRSGCPDGVPLRSGPSNDDPVVLHVPEHSSLAVEDMVEQWMRVRLSEEDTAWINIYHVHVTPPSVHASGRNRVNLRPVPNSDETYGTFELAGSYTVRDVALDQQHRRWFLIDVGAQEGWVAGWLFQPDFVFPIVHFVEGLYRYARLDFAGAQRALERFTERGAETESNVTLATAYRFLAAARLAASDPGGAEAAEHALRDLDAAAALTPFDPDLRLLRALVSFGAAGRFGDGVDELAEALALDDRNPSTRGLLHDVTHAAREPGGPIALNGGFPPPEQAAARLEALAAEY